MHRLSAWPSRRFLLTAIAAALLPVRKTHAALPLVRVHKDPNCGCCTGWIRHLQKAGFSVEAIETADLQAVRTRLGVPEDLASCHTAEVAGYVVEGHVPAVAITRLLSERPAARGLSVPGMPIGSPGMEGGVPERYDVILFAADGQRVFMRFLGARQV